MQRENLYYKTDIKKATKLPSRSLVHCLPLLRCKVVLSIYIYGLIQKFHFDRKIPYGEKGSRRKELMTHFLPISVERRYANKPHGVEIRINHVFGKSRGFDSRMFSVEFLKAISYPRRIGRITKGCAQLCERGYRRSMFFQSTRSRDHKSRRQFRRQRDSAIGALHSDPAAGRRLQYR